MKTRKILAALLAVVCLFSTAALLTSCFGAPAGGATLVYTLNDDGSSYSVTGIECDKNAVNISIEIPETYEGMPVTAVGDQAFLRCYELISVSFPASIQVIGKEAFRQCNLETINFHADGELIEIGQFAFANCPMTSITIPSSVETIADDAFYNCNYMATVTFAADSQLKQIGARAFWMCGLTSITLPKSVTAIKEDAFNGCFKLETVTLEEGSMLETIGANTFNRCAKLKSFTFPTSMKKISTGVFYECTALETVTFENPNGWRVNTESFETSDGEPATLSDPAANAALMKEHYIYRWLHN